MVLLTLLTQPFEKNHGKYLFSCHNRVWECLLTSAMGLLLIKALVWMLKIYGFTSQIIFPKAYPGTAVFCFCNSVVLSSFMDNLLWNHMPGRVLQSVQSKHWTFSQLNISLWELQDLPCISAACSPTCWWVFALLMAEYFICDLGVIFGINFCVVQQWEKLGNWDGAWFVAQFSDYLI